MRSLHICLLLAYASLALACPALDSLRTQYVIDSFDPNKEVGEWFEVAFTDIGQLGANCQMYNRQFTSAGLIDESFNATYLGSQTPLNIHFEYNATGEAGMFKKWVKGGQALLQLPTVVVDVMLSNDGTSYLASTEFTCTTVLGVDVTEVRIGFRKPGIDDTLLSQLEARARAQGVPFTNLTRVDYSHCVLPH